MAAQLSSEDNDWLHRTGRALDRAGFGEPTHVIDLDRLDQNISRLRKVVPASMAIRLVQKSLPSLSLLRYIGARLHCKHLMVFHRAWLNHYAQHAPDLDLMLGKPMPVAAARTYYVSAGIDPIHTLHPGPHWLIDTMVRLQQYLALARECNVRLRICIEIDVGLHRGGMRSVDDTDALLNLIAQHPEHLQWTGLMGYDAHAAKVPCWVGHREAVQRSQETYRAFIERCRAGYPCLWRDDLVFNGAGSLTFTLHDTTSVVNELSVGSALLKPTDFDLPTLIGFKPSAVLAVPVLKSSMQLDIPFIAPLSRKLSVLLPQHVQSIHLYGGRFMAKPIWPPGMRVMPLIGPSSNQQLMTLPDAHVLQPDDWTFWRPTQSEQALLQHGTLLGMRGEQIVDRFPIDP